MYKIAIIKYLEEHGFEAFRPKAVLFDMDGVLYDSMPNHAIAWQSNCTMRSTKPKPNVCMMRRVVFSIVSLRPRSCRASST